MIEDMRDWSSRQFREAGFDTLQADEICWGLENGLSPEQVAVYARPEFGWQQMEQIRWGFAHGLDESQVATYARPEFDWGQMLVIRDALQDGLAKEQISYMTRLGIDGVPLFNGWQMQDIHLAFKDGMTSFQIEALF